MAPGTGESNRDRPTECKRRWIMFRTLTPWTARAPRGGIDFELPAWMDRVFRLDEDWWPDRGAFVPRTDMTETPTAIEITAELPGMKPEDVKVELQDGRLTIHGEKREEKEEKDTTFHRVERRFGEFRRVLDLPRAVEEDKITAEFKDGLLKVVVPKTAEAQPRHIEVKA